MADPADLVARVHATLARAGLVEPRAPLVAAVSGGADSLCLLDALVAALPDAPNRLIVGHVDHQLRSESSQDADHVGRLAATYGLRCEIMPVDVPALALSERRGIEEAARIGRYRALGNLAAHAGASAVLTGHTRDDSVETVLMHLLRGTGRQGLGGIAEDERLNVQASGAPSQFGGARRVRIVRPLLGSGRAEITAYCAARGIRWLTDPTNADPAMLRNRVRGHLLPVLRTYNPSVDEALERLALVMRDEEVLLAETTAERYRGIVRQSENRAEIELAAWRTLPIALQRRLARQLAQAAGHQEISFDAVERALAVGHNDGPGRTELGGGLIVERRRDHLVFQRKGRGNHDDGGPAVESGG